MHYLPRKIRKRLCSRRLERQLLETYSQTRERHNKLNGYRILTMQNNVGKLMGRIVGRKLARYLEEREILPVNQGDSDQYNAHGKIQLHLNMTYTKDSRGKNKQWLWQSIFRMLTTEFIQAAEGPARTIWSQPNTDPVGCRSAPGKNSVYAAWKLELCPSSAHFGPTTRITVLPILFSVCTPKAWQI